MEAAALAQASGCRAPPAGLALLGGGTAVAGLSLLATVHPAVAVPVRAAFGHGAMLAWLVLGMALAVFRLVLAMVLTLLLVPGVVLVGLGRRGLGRRGLGGGGGGDHERDRGDKDLHGLLRQFD